MSKNIRDMRNSKRNAFLIADFILCLSEISARFDDMLSTTKVKSALQIVAGHRSLPTIWVSWSEFLEVKPCEMT